MASLLAPRSADPRLSQVLPSVKCSDCGKPVTLDALGDHKCAPATSKPPPPAPTPFRNPLAAAVAAMNNKPQTPAPAPAAAIPPIAKKPPPSAAPPAPPVAPAPIVKTGPSLPAPTRDAAALLPDRLKNLVGNQQGRSSPGPGPAPVDPRVKPPFSTQPPPPGNSRSPPPIINNNNTNTVASNGRASVQQPPALARSPSNDRQAPASVRESTRPLSPPNRTFPPMRSMTPQVMSRPPPPPDPIRERAVSSASMRPQVPPPPQQQQQQQQQRPGGNGAFLGPGPESGRFNPPPRSASAAPAPPAVYQAGPAPAPAPPQPLSVSRTIAQISPPADPEEYVETRTGGEAGMAGVGRRGFAAAARAAMFAQSQGKPADMFMQPFDFARAMTPQPVGMDGRRINVPQPLNLANIPPRDKTPPLSPESQSAYSPRSSIASPHEGRNDIPKPVVSASESFISRSRAESNASISPLTPLTPADPSTPGTPRLPFFEKFKAAGTPTTATMHKPPPPPPAHDDDDSDSEYGGLAYARSEGDESDSTSRPPSTVRFPTNGSGNAARASVARSTSSASSYSSKAASALGRGLGALSDDDDDDDDRRTEVESVADDASTTLGDALGDARVPPTRTPTAPSVGSDRAVRLPQRALTGPSSINGSAAPSVRRRKVCVSCDEEIGDGKWIKTDGAGVLCVKCWKNMYLPRCRRCDLTIEKAAVSSSDGQLKGKYHRECFNCHTCQKPFPDKTFYVFDGRPYCQMHYHEVNDSLCAAALCGQPIEGPCAVSHAGDRYHPEHLLCEYDGCDERLLDYWEVDGRMLCDRHARRVEEEAATEEGEVSEALARRAMKRKTRLINLDAASGLR